MIEIDSLFLEKNLFKFYEDFNGFKDFKLVTNDSYNSISSSEFQWPGFVYNIVFDNKNSNKIYDELYKKINQGELPPFLLVNSSKVPEDFEEKMYERDTRKIDSWPIIYIDLTQFENQFQPICNFVISKINDKDKLEEWYRIVASVLFTSKTFSFDFFIKQLNNKKYSFYLGYFNNIPVSTALLINDEFVTGFYMIATNPNYRKRGFGTEMVKKLIIDSKNIGKKIITAQSSRMAFPLYQQIGFLNKNSIDVYWMFGK